MKIKLIASSVAIAALGTFAIDSSLTSAQAQRLVWTDSFQTALYSSNLDGSDAMEILDVTTLGSGRFRPVGITTNGTNLFWTDPSQDALYSSNLDGSGAMEILDVTTLGFWIFFPPQGITTNGTNLFWV